MLVPRQIAFSKFSQTRIVFEQHPHCLYGGVEGLTVKLGLSKTDPNELASVELFYPLADDGHQTIYRAAVDTFWAVTLPGTPRAETLELRDDAFHPRREYEKIYGEVRVTLSEGGGQILLGAYPV